MKPFLFAVAFGGLASVAVADPLDTLVPEYEAYVDANSPEGAARTAGLAPDRWSDVTPEAIAEQADAARALLEEVQKAETEREIDQAILIRLLDSDIVWAETDSARIPFVGDWGFQAEPVFAALRVNLDSEAAAEAWIARLNDVPRYFDENIANMRRGIETGWTAHKDPLDTVIAQIREQVVDDPAESDLYAPFLSLPENMDPAVAERLKAEGLTATRRAMDAYLDAWRFLEIEYKPYLRQGAGIAGLENGQSVYAAMVEYHTAGAGDSPVEIHQLGLSEVARIRSEMEAIIAEIGFEGSFEEFLTHLRTDPKFYAQSADELMAAAEEISSRLRASLPDYFGNLPELEFEVQPVPDAIAPGYTTGRYVSGDPEEGRLGIYLVNTYALDQRPLYELPALSAHEAVPGHHLQIALAQEMSDQPKFRQDYYATAFGEGWGLYAERIAGEAGIYRTPYERFGALSYEMWRACRLVADTGLHWYGWTRSAAEACFIENSALAPLNIQTEVTRYIGWPGQAVAYKVGELKIRELRARADASLGDSFDVREFHDALLAEGAVPLDVMEARIDDWIAAQHSTASNTDTLAD
ncbi:MAG TPA: DUF885 domain-containing protein [Hyphomonas atlantica]|nr:DUF885 domain-containing protein [Hyphomonas atlantica]